MIDLQANVVAALADQTLKARWQQDIAEVLPALRADGAGDADARGASAAKAGLARFITAALAIAFMEIADGL